MFLRQQVQLVGVVQYKKIGVALNKVLRIDLSHLVVISGKRHSCQSTEASLFKVFLGHFCFYYDRTAEDISKPISLNSPQRILVLCEVCMLSSCLCGFPPGILDFICLYRPCDELVTHPGLAPAACARSNNGWMMLSVSNVFFFHEKADTSTAETSKTHTKTISNV